MNNNRLEEIRARRAKEYGHSFTGTIGTDAMMSDIDYLLSLLDARPAVAADAREAASELVAEWVKHEYGQVNHLHPLIDRITAYANQRYRDGMIAAAKEVCGACDNEAKYGPARKIEGSTRWWHGMEPCEARGIRTLLAEDSKQK